MLYSKRMLILLLLAALILSACQPLMLVELPISSMSSAAQPPTPRIDAPTYGVRGPYTVGVREIVIEPGREGDRPLTVSVWYPALNPNGAEEVVTYRMDFLADPSTGFEAAGRALRNAPPDPSGSAYPLVLYSHGAWCSPTWGSFLTEHLASHGFVVMAALHEDNWSTVMGPIYQSEISRPQDMVRQLDFAEELTASPGEFAGIIDMEHVAVSGQSYGGQIALEMGGARLDLTDFLEEYCMAYPQDSNCAQYSEHLEELVALAGLDTMPDDLWPDWSDPRVDVVLATAPAVSRIGRDGLAGMNRPLMVLVGTNDNWIGDGMDYLQFYETLPSPDKSRVLFENADHMIFGNPCSAVPGMVELSFFFACSDQVWDIARANDLTNHFATAFLLAELKGDIEAAAALTPENVNFPGIQYETTAYVKRISD